MKVICRGHKTCKYRYDCKHSISHDFISRTVLSCGKMNINHPHNCDCSEIFLRKEKLEKLKMF